MPRHYGCVRGAIYGTDQPIADSKREKEEPKRVISGMCVICGKKLPVNKRKYCSHECSNYARAAQEANRRRRNEARRVENMRKARLERDRGLEGSESTAD